MGESGQKKLDGIPVFFSKINRLPVSFTFQQSINRYLNLDNTGITEWNISHKVEEADITDHTDECMNRAQGMSVQTNFNPHLDRPELMIILRSQQI